MKNIDVKKGDIPYILHKLCYLQNIEHITSYEEFEELKINLLESEPEGWIFSIFTQPQMLRIMRWGVEKGLFSKPYWVGTGTTPYSGAAKRQRMWDVLGIPVVPPIKIENYRIKVVCDCVGEECVESILICQLKAFLKRRGLL